MECTGTVPPPKTNADGSRDRTVSLLRPVRIARDSCVDPGFNVRHFVDVARKEHDVQLSYSLAHPLSTGFAWP